MTRRASIEDCRTYYAGQDAEELDVAIVQGIASRTVEQLAPEPVGDTLDPDYEEARREVELFVGKFIWKRDGLTLTSKSLSGVTSKSYANLQEVRDMVASGMGSYAGSGASGEATAIVGTARFLRG